MRTIHHLKDLLFYVLVAQHGRMVADQFRDTWDGEPVHEQNRNAMDEIKYTMENMIKSGFFSEDSIMEIQDYLKTINEDDDEDFDHEDDDQLNESTRKGKKVIRITESQLRRIIEKSILNK